MPVLSSAIVIPALFYYGLNSSFQVDEFQHLHISWYLKEGFQLYRDCYDHHGPLFPFLNALVWKIFSLPDNPTTFSVFRHLMVLFNICFYGLFLLFAKRLFSIQVAFVALTSTMLCDAYLYHAFQIRPAIMISMMTLGALYFGFSKRNIKNLLLTGTIWVLSLFTSPKIIIPFITFYVIQFMTKRIRLKEFLITLIPIIILIFFWILHLHANNSWDFFKAQVIEVNITTIPVYLKYVPAYLPYTPLVIITSALILTASIILARTRKIRIKIDQNLLTILAVSIVTIAFTIIMRRYRHWYLMTLPLINIVLAQMVLSYLDLYKLKHQLKTLFYIILLFIAFYRSYTIFQLPDHNLKKWQIANTNSILKSTPKDHKLLFLWNGDYKFGTPRQGGFVFRKHFTFYWNTDLGLGPHESKSQIEALDIYFSHEIKQRKNNLLRIYMCPDTLSKLSRLNTITKKSFHQVAEDPCIWAPL